ncbi:MAG: 4Fe-4S binding protein [Desulfobacteraceae bacterium]|jgi:Fe-S-cluster-containing dehydrogenase component
MKPYELVIDHASCWGCRTCEVACKQENRDPVGVRRIQVLEEGPEIRNGEPHFLYHVRVCRHCDEPPCVEVCPEEAITKRADGLVVLNPETCIGCGLCVEACPYGAVVVDSERGSACKCDLCFERVDHGLVPACADNVCPGHCIYFGDPEAIQKEITEKHARRFSFGEGP